jgi:hypothetical protein
LSESCCLESSICARRTATQEAKHNSLDHENFIVNRIRPSLAVLSYVLRLHHSRACELSNRRYLPSRPCSLSGVATANRNISGGHSQASSTAVSPHENYVWSHNDTPEVQYAKNEIKAAVKNAIHGLSHRDRQVVTMHHIEELSTNEIASVMEVTPLKFRVCLFQGARQTFGGSLIAEGISTRLLKHSHKECLHLGYHAASVSPPVPEWTGCCSSASACFCPAASATASPQELAKCLRSFTCSMGVTRQRCHLPQAPFFGVLRRCRRSLQCGSSR